MVKIAAIVLHVYFPKIAVEKIEQLLRCGNFYLLEWKLDTSPANGPKFPDVEAADLRAMILAESRFRCCDFFPHRELHDVFLGAIGAIQHTGDLPFVHHGDAVADV